MHLSILKGENLNEFFWYLKICKLVWQKAAQNIFFSHRLFPALNLGSFLALTFPQHWVGPAPQDSYRCHLYRCHWTCIGDTRFLSVPLDWLVPGWCLFLLNFWEQLIDGRPQVVQRRCLTQNIIQRGHEHRSYSEGAWRRIWRLRLSWRGPSLKGAQRQQNFNICKFYSLSQMLSQDIWIRFHCVQPHL